MRLVVEEALAEPTMEQLKAAGLDLTEEQADQIYLYAIKGAKGAGSLSFSARKSSV